jgi:hypothetical protein
MDIIVNTLCKGYNIMVVVVVVVVAAVVAAVAGTVKL